eukprot:ANDGO_02837.mRNA.1 mitochondrial Lipoamide acyltransferase component of branched-chain alpha-keto acid dehydrogenase complex
MHTRRFSSLIKAWPSAKRLAAENGISLALLCANAHRGVVSKTDVLDYVRTHPGSAAIPSLTRQNAPSGARLPPFAVTAVPTFGLSDSAVSYAVDVSAIIAGQMDMSVKTVVWSLFVKSFSNCIAAYPILNAYLSADKSSIVLRKDVNVRVRIGQAQIVIPNAAQQSLRSILTRINTALAMNPRAPDANSTIEASVDLDLLESGQIANPVIAPGTSFAASMFYPVPEIQFDQESKIATLDVVRASFVGDHRIVDGGTCARFSSDLISLLSNPLRLIVPVKK